MVSLKEINTEVDNQYGPFIVEDVDGGDVILRNPIRLVANERAQLSEKDAALRAAQEAQDANAALDVGRDILRLVSVGDGGERLLDELGDDAAKLMYVLRLYSEAVQLGEALSSDESSTDTAQPSSPTSPSITAST